MGCRGLWRGRPNTERGVLQTSHPNCSHRKAIQIMGALAACACADTYTFRALQHRSAKPRHLGWMGGTAGKLVLRRVTASGKTPPHDSRMHIAPIELPAFMGCHMQTDSMCNRQVVTSSNELLSVALRCLPHAIQFIALCTTFIHEFHRGQIQTDKRAVQVQYF